MPPGLEEDATPIPLSRIERLMLLAPAVLIWGFVGASPAAPAPPSCAAKDNAFLASLVGEWEVDAEFRSGESWEAASGRASIKPDLGGCVVLERYDGTRFGKPWAFLAILGANGGGGSMDEKNPIQEVFVHSQHGILSLSSGRVEGGARGFTDGPGQRGPHPARLLRGFARRLSIREPALDRPGGELERELESALPPRSEELELGPAVSSAARFSGRHRRFF